MNAGYGKEHRRGNGYGRIGIKGKNILAHRYSYELAHGEIPPGLIICHTCDNPLCVRPAHLYAGTNQDNVNDSMRRGRNGRATLTWEKVDKIRRLHSSGKCTRSFLAEWFGVTLNTIDSIMSNRTWRKELRSEG